MKKSFKKVILIIGSIIVILVATNPSNSNFREYLHSKSYRIAKDNSRVYGRYGRHRNYLIFSIYYYDCYRKDYCKKYIGILKNFIKIN